MRFTQKHLSSRIASYSFEVSLRWVILLTFSFRLFAGSFDDVTPSPSEEILSLTTDLLVDGFVSVTSGQISISEVDLTVRGAQDLSLKRTYVPPRIMGRYDDKDKVDRLALGKELCQLETKGWAVHPHLFLEIFKTRMA